ncbi:MAG: nuclear transport factor 2 family protein [Acidimicrobiaceae bacterium]|jgi:uncharacterized protein (TIGR02246 family)|nr:nuclear transport factor 2 family protein [Acidimicrobiaceae bacterium]
MGEAPQINPLAIATYATDPLIGADCAGRQAVAQLIHTYSYAWDSRDTHATASLFTEDAELAFFVNGTKQPTQKTVGRESILEGMSARSTMLKRWQIETRHLMLNTVFGPIENDAIQAITTAVIYWQQLPAHPQPIAVQTGYYKSWCVETSDGWLFQRRATFLSGIFHPRELYDKPAMEEPT